MRPTTPPSQAADYLPLFQQLLPTEVLCRIIKEGQGRFYQRVYTPLILLWGFVYQRLQENSSCDSVVSHLGSGALDEWDLALRQSLKPNALKPPLPPLSQRIHESNSAFCQGRQRLSGEVLKSTLTQSARSIREAQGERGLWKGRQVFLLDGSTLLLQSTSSLIEHYGRHKNQHGDSYWPLMRFVIAFDMLSAAVEHMEEGVLKESEQELTWKLFQNIDFSKDSPAVFVADANFGVYSVVQAAAHHHAEVLLRVTPVRFEALLRRLKQEPLKEGEQREIEWTPSRYDQLAESLEEFAQPVRGRLIYVKLKRKGFTDKDLYFFSTLNGDFSVDDLVELYGQRWHVELSLRYVKSELKLEQLQSKSVDMARKEFTAGLIAYNLIRGFMAEAAKRQDISPLTLSFKRCWRRLFLFGMNCKTARETQQVADKMDNLFRILGECRIQKRKPREHPRCVRTKPRAYPILSGERHRNPDATKS